MNLDAAFAPIVKLLVLTLVIWTGRLPLSAQVPKPTDTKIIVILGAFGEEIDLLQEKLTEKQIDTIQGVLFARGRLHKKKW